MLRTGAMLLTGCHAAGAADCFTMLSHNKSKEIISKLDKIALAQRVRTEDPTKN